MDDSLTTQIPVFVCSLDRDSRDKLSDVSYDITDNKDKTWSSGWTNQS